MRRGRLAEIPEVWSEASGYSDEVVDETAVVDGAARGVGTAVRRQSVAVFAAGVRGLLWGARAWGWIEGVGSRGGEREGTDAEAARVEEVAAQVVDVLAAVAGVVGLAATLLLVHGTRRVAAKRSTRGSEGGSLDSSRQLSDTQLISGGVREADRCGGGFERRKTSPRPSAQGRSRHRDPKFSAPTGSGGGCSTASEDDAAADSVEWTTYTARRSAGGTVAGHLVSQTVVAGPPVVTSSRPLGTVISSSSSEGEESDGVGDDGGFMDDTPSSAPQGADGAEHRLHVSTIRTIPLRPLSGAVAAKALPLHVGTPKFSDMAPAPMAAAATIPPVVLGPTFSRGLLDLSVHSDDLLECELTPLVSAIKQVTPRSPMGSTWNGERERNGDYGGGLLDRSVDFGGSDGDGDRRGGSVTWADALGSSSFGGRSSESDEVNAKGEAISGRQFSSPIEKVEIPATATQTQTPQADQQLQQHAPSQRQWREQLMNQHHRLATGRAAAAPVAAVAAATSSLGDGEGGSNGGGSGGGSGSVDGIEWSYLKQAEDDVGGGGWSFGEDAAAAAAAAIADTPPDGYSPSGGSGSGGVGVSRGESVNGDGGSSSGRIQHSRTMGDSGGSGEGNFGSGVDSGGRSTGGVGMIGARRRSLTPESPNTPASTSASWNTATAPRSGNGNIGGGGGSSKGNSGGGAGGGGGGGRGGGGSGGIGGGSLWSLGLETPPPLSPRGLRGVSSLHPEEQRFRVAADKRARARAYSTGLKRGMPVALPTLHPPLRKKDDTRDEEVPRGAGSVKHAQPWSDR